MDIGVNVPSRGYLCCIGTSEDMNVGTITTYPRYANEYLVGVYGYGFTWAASGNITVYRTKTWCAIVICKV